MTKVRLDVQAREGDVLEVVEGEVVDLECYSQAGRLSLLWTKQYSAQTLQKYSNFIFGQFQEFKDNTKICFFCGIKSLFFMGEWKKKINLLVIT